MLVISLLNTAPSIVLKGSLAFPKHKKAVMFLLEKMCGRWASLVQEVTLLLAVSAMVTSQRDI